jgi:4-aminobutyrate aminotransferase-like enzyme
MLREICDAHKLLLIADEIYTGFNRTGALFACDRFAVVPDLICPRKGAHLGFPAFCLASGRADVMDAWPLSTGEALHTSTFLGNPLGCAMALASLEQHADPELARTVKARGARLKAALEAIRAPQIGQVRGPRADAGHRAHCRSIPVRQPANSRSRSVQRALRDGVLLLADSPTSNVLSFAPPFAISDEEIGFVAGRIQEYLTSLPGSIS